MVPTLSQHLEMVGFLLGRICLSLFRRLLPMIFDCLKKLLWGMRACGYGAIQSIIMSFSASHALGSNWLFAKLAVPDIGVAHKRGLNKLHRIEFSINLYGDRSGGQDILSSGHVSAFSRRSEKRSSLQARSFLRPLI